MREMTHRGSKSKGEVASERGLPEQRCLDGRAVSLAAATAVLEELGVAQRGVLGRVALLALEPFAAEALLSDL